jgi:hypothetical protein
VPNADARIALVAARPVVTTVRRGQSVDVALRAPTAVAAPIRRGQRVGTATVTVDGEPVGRVAAVAARPLKPASGLVASVDDAIPGPRVVVWLLVVAAAAFVILIAAAFVRRPG